MKNNIRLSDDPYLSPYLPLIEQRGAKIKETEKKLTDGKILLKNFASAHEYYGLHYKKNQWVFREWAPNATQVFLIGDFNNWKIKGDYELNRINENGDWEIILDKDKIQKKSLFKLKIFWKGGEGERIPAYARRVVQDEHTKIFSAQVWNEKYNWKISGFKPKHSLLKIYETHVGMSMEKEGIANYEEFTKNILPRIKLSGYNAIQLMAIPEHPYYGSFGYHVSSFFAPSSRFGTPEELKQLIDKAHELDISVIIDLVHSHAVKNETEGLSRFDGTLYQYFHEGGKGYHEGWDSRLFDYGKTQVLHFLLSNCRYWLDEFKVDGYRFDGITSMLYLHHGMMHSFASYNDYFNNLVDEEAYVYLSLANKVIHQVNPKAITIAEDISGMPGLAYPNDENGCGFDYRLAMGVTDYWFKMLKDIRDEDWNMDSLWHELTNRRAEEKTISYVECHDQALVGGKTLIFELADREMYTSMHKGHHNLVIDRAIALHKLARLVTFGTAHRGYLNFMGNEFGHPEWIDFPRAGNNWSYHYCRRQWSLRDNPDLIYHSLAEFDKEMINKIYDIGDSFPIRLYIHNHDKIIAFRRADYIIIINFHPHNSFSDYAIYIDRPGKYKLIFDTDREQFGGYNRIEKGQEYFTLYNGNNNYLQAYIPCRCGLVLKYGQ